MIYLRKTIKTLSRISFILACIPLISAIITSCGSDEPDPNNPLDYTSMINKSYNITYSVNVADPSVLSDIADLKIEYVDGEGKIQTEILTNYTWNKNYVYEMKTGTAFGLKATWVFRDRSIIEKMLEEENKLQTISPRTYNLYVDITSPYTTIKQDDTHIDAVFKSQRSPYMSDKDLTLAAIVKEKLNQKVYTEWYWKVKTTANIQTMESNAFPSAN